MIRPRLALDSHHLLGNQEDHQEPANQMLWRTLTVQARAKFPKYPSPAASAWIHKRYVDMGGRFLKREEAKRKHAREREVEKRRKAHLRGEDKDKDKAGSR